jgi:hypothetical protein
MRGLQMTSYATLALYALAAAALGVSIAARRRDGTTRSTALLGVALAAALGAIAAATLVPDHGPGERQLVPLIHIIRGLRPPIHLDDVPLDVTANLGLFLPVGAALCLLGLRRRTTVITAICLSTTVEITQLFVPGRTSSVDDVLLNTLGALLGYALVLRSAPTKRSAGGRAS